ncbi:hypothetical protein LPB140_09730 [Sphingorhabdus lutea]|uniref:Bifunctional diguanylate cyclase/phosphodiesterase n=1 Tax=Sphingorhabdus lutea TaxID=1913578 RepID=A0A1L3JD00_9SPHN|nr:bifunctional diguanylate cyclase/phosphodiesterase [Sphingorhabdus lutea]APG63021.1 hypothetical protein LPB140_09730 [Sphingorhabdus lutea]
MQNNRVEKQVATATKYQKSGGLERLSALDSRSENIIGAIKQNDDQGESPHPHIAKTPSWLCSLPLAGAIFTWRDNKFTLLYNNEKFQHIVGKKLNAEAFDLSIISDMLREMAATGRERDFVCWRGNNRLLSRQLDIHLSIYDTANSSYLITINDRTQEQLHRETLRREMTCDSLTGFPNRIGFEEIVEQRVKEAQKNSDDKNPGRYAFILIDLARFSRVNESMGSMAGDELIITVARRLKSQMRGNEILARLGGNEFAAFIEIGVQQERTHHIGERIKAAFNDPCQISGMEIQMECAVAAAVGRYNEDPTDILRNAQIALKRAKSQKKFVLYHHESLNAVKQRFSIETDLRRAIEKEELELHYQPIMDLKSGRVNGFEALARWIHPEQGFISPVDFIPVAEESGLIVPLGRWAMYQAAMTIADWDSQIAFHNMGSAPKIGHADYKISVNLSAIQILRDDVVGAVRDSIFSAGVDGHRLMLELTESAFIDDPDGTLKLLNRLKSENISLAMDDFGTGYSNLAVLQKLPIDVLKIDRSFVTDMGQDKEKNAIVSTILSLAKALDMQTTAEGIETSNIGCALKLLGCTFGQGYHYAKPLKSDEAFQFLSNSFVSDII